MNPERNKHRFPPEVRAFLEEVAEELQEQLAKKRSEGLTITKSKQEMEGH